MTMYNNNLFQNEIKYYFYKEMYYNPNIMHRLLSIYKYILGLLFIVCLIKNNLIYIENILDNFLFYYVQEFNEFVVHMDSLDNNNPYGEGSSNNVPTGTGPPNNNPVGLESTAENENSNKRKRKSTTTNSKKKSKKNAPESLRVSLLRKSVSSSNMPKRVTSYNSEPRRQSNRSKPKNKHDRLFDRIFRVNEWIQEKLEKLKNKYKTPERRKRYATNRRKREEYSRILGEKVTGGKNMFKLRYRKKIHKYDWPAFRYYDKDLSKYVYPEMYHSFPPNIVLASNTIRIYNESHMRYTYYCNHFKESERYCKIQYPDGTFLFLFDKSRVTKHIEFNRWNTYLGYRMNPKFILTDYFF